MEEGEIFSDGNNFYMLLSVHLSYFVHTKLWEIETDRIWF